LKIYFNEIEDAENGQEHVDYYSVFITALPVAVVTTVQEVAGV
jgi:hypothetical protein